MALKYFILAIFALAISAYSYLLPYPNPMPKVSTPYDDILRKTWEGIKKRNVDAYSTGLVHRPKSNSPDDAVSEGVSYGMFLALYANDQTYFNKIWNAGEQFMWNSSGGYYDWRRNSTGGNMGDSGPASDAEQDIALLLIFADQLVKNGIWKSYTSTKGATYDQRARSILQTIRGSMIDQGKYLKPGHWGGTGTLNPGYFAPAFYRIFGEFEPEHKATWNALINGSYEVIAKSPGYSKGLIPDWSTSSGGSTGGAGYNAYFDGDALYRDAIRVYWRLATDYLWYGEPKAKTFLDNAIKFLESKGGPGSANFFDMNGNLLPAADTETLGIGKQNIVRTRREHSQLTMGMWAAAAMGSGGITLAEDYSDELLKFYKSGTDYWGYATDPAGGTEDTLHNEMYFDQFLAWFGASLLGGAFTNVWEDLKDGVPQGPPEWKKWPVLNTQIIDASKEPLRVNASFTNSARWTATFTNDLNGNTVSFSAKSDTINLTWYGLSETGSYMPQGFYTLTINASGLDKSYSAKVWLGKPYASSLMDKNRLLVDDFADGNLIPYIGKEWISYLDSRDGAGSSTGQLSVSGEWLSWKYTLTGGGDPYAALEWNCGECDLRGIDSIVVIAKSGGGSNINVSVQLISSDFNFPSEYQYFEDSLQLTSTSKEYKLPISRFKQRMNGSGKDKNKTLEKMTGIRFHIQSGSGSAGTIMVDKIYFTGDVSKIYNFTNPPEYKEPTGPIPEPPTKIIRLAQHKAYSIRKSLGMVHINLQPNMAGASVTLMDAKGRVAKKMNVSQNGELNISTENLATGIYFAEVKKPGAPKLILTIPPI